MGLPAGCRCGLVLSCCLRCHPHLGCTLTHAGHVCRCRRQAAGVDGRPHPPRSAAILSRPSAFCSPLHLCPSTLLLPQASGWRRCQTPPRSTITCRPRRGTQTCVHSSPACPPAACARCCCRLRDAAGAPHARLQLLASCCMRVPPPAACRAGRSRRGTTARALHLPLMHSLVPSIGHPHDLAAPPPMHPWLQGWQVKVWRDYERFIEDLTALFPHEKEGIRALYDEFWKVGACRCFCMCSGRAVCVHETRIQAMRPLC